MNTKAFSIHFHEHQWFKRFDGIVNIYSLTYLCVCVSFIWLYCCIHSLAHSDLSSIFLFLPLAVPTANALKNLLIQLQYNVTDQDETRLDENSLKQEQEKKKKLSSLSISKWKQPSSLVIKFCRITADSKDSAYSFSRLLSQVRSLRSRSISSNIVLANAHEIEKITSAVRSA